MSPSIMVLSLTTHKGVQDFAFTKEQALLVAKTMKETAERGSAQAPKARGNRARSSRDVSAIEAYRQRDRGAAELAVGAAS